MDASQVSSGDSLFVWGASVKYKYKVRHQEYHVARIWSCTKESDGASVVVEGMVTFRNPYGFIPARDYGLLPFEVRASACFDGPYCAGLYHVMGGHLMSHYIA